MPMGTGKTTTAVKLQKQGLNVHEIDKVKEQSGVWGPEVKEKFKKLRRVAVDKGDWSDYSKEYDPLLIEAITKFVENHGPIGTLLNHGEIEGYPIKYVMRDPLQHIIDTARRTARKGNLSTPDGVRDFYKTMMVGVTNADDVASKEWTLVKTYDEMERTIAKWTKEDQA